MDENADKITAIDDVRENLIAIESLLKADNRDISVQSRVLNEQIETLQKIKIAQEQLRAQLQETQQKLEHAVRTRDEVISIVSHELRTPLNAFGLEFYTRRYYLEHGKMEEFAADKIARMIDFDDRQLSRLTRLMNDALDVSRIRNGQLSIRPTPVNLGDVVQSVIAQLALQCEAAGCSVEIIQRAPVVGHWDEFRLEQAVINVLLNALRHGAGKAIEMTVKEVGCGARLSIKDNGDGILPENQQRIFQQFAHSGENKRSKGLGVGLFITDQIVKAHNGRIHVCSMPGEGATFSILLPLKPSESCT